MSRNQVDGALAAADMVMMAEGCGLGGLCSGFFAMAANRSHPLRRLLGLNRGDKAVTTPVFSYPGVCYHRTVQKELASVHFFSSQDS